MVARHVWKHPNGTLLWITGYIKKGCCTQLISIILILIRSISKLQFRFDCTLPIFRYIFNSCLTNLDAASNKWAGHVTIMLVILQRLIYTVE